MCTHAKVNCLKWNSISIKMDLALNNQRRLTCHIIQTSKQKINGDYLEAFSIENTLSLQNTKFQEKKRGTKLWTYIYLINAKAQPDYMFINRKWINSTFVRYIPLFNEYLSITESSRQTNACVYAEIRHKQSNPHDMTVPHVLRKI